MTVARPPLTHDNTLMGEPHVVQFSTTSFMMMSHFCDFFRRFMACHHVSHQSSGSRRSRTLKIQRRHLDAFDTVEQTAEHLHVTQCTVRE